MEISFDLQADAVYIQLSKGKFDHIKKMDEDTILDYDAKGHLLGIEILGASTWMSTKDLSCIKVNMPLKTMA